MSWPDDRRYSPDDLWARPEPAGVRIGVTPVLVRAVGEVRSVALPAPGEALVAAAELGRLEGDKLVLALFAPCDGTVLAVNPALAARPGLVGEDPLGAGWLLLAQPAGDLHLLDAGAYAARVGAAGPP